ncbi:hypothetical protein H2201_000252 [Coniosporium apollinis]|uniref:ABC transporter domain-containing protein n=1 Tax=Coniosporium apollinis TaxID=61459 RepID=A0ABQ9P6Y3_9PEZI|nr:hypothetical protein H2201_000252 [Coniosporium apollinis]
MRRTRSLLYHATPRLNQQLPLISISNATFYRQHPASVAPAGHDVPPNPPLFPGLTLSLPSHASPNQHWSILSPSSSARTTFLQVLRGQYLCFPPTARSYPYLSSPEIAAKDPRLRSPATAIQYVGFDAERGGLGGSSTQGAYLSARYESRREETDFSVIDYLRGNTELNAAEELVQHPPEDLLERVVGDLRLDALVDMPVSNLSNGQTRRARIAKALLARPELLLLDGPFMGLDPPTLSLLSGLLHRLAEANAPRLVLSLRPQDMIPDWITHMLYVDENYEVGSSGTKEDVFRYIRREWEKASASTEKSKKISSIPSIMEVGRHLHVAGLLEDKPLSYAEDKDGNLDVSRLTLEDEKVYEEAKSKHKTGILDIEARPLTHPVSNRPPVSRDGFGVADEASVPLGNPLVEMEGVNIRYGSRSVLGDWRQEVNGTSQEGLWWKVLQGQRWGIFGPNGSGKTTLLSLITSDHPQTYSAPIRLFQRSRLPSPGQPGISLFDIQSRIGHSSPEVHAFFPKRLSVRRTLESAWADAPLSKPILTYEADTKVDACLQWFRAELNPALGLSEAQRREQYENYHWATYEGKKANKRRTERAEALLPEDEQLDWADEMVFGELTFSAQRVALFLRAVVKNPELVILDEAFSGMDDAARDRCITFLTHGQTRVMRYVGQNGRPLSAGPRLMESDASFAGQVKVPGLLPSQALLVVSHNKDEVPGCVREWMCLPEPGMGAPRFGRLDGPLELDPRGERWAEIWGTGPGSNAKLELPTTEQQVGSAVEPDPAVESQAPNKRRRRQSRAIQKAKQASAQQSDEDAH